MSIHLSKERFASSLLLVGEVEKGTPREAIGYCRLLYDSKMHIHYIEEASLFCNPSPCDNKLTSSLIGLVDLQLHGDNGIADSSHNIRSRKSHPAHLHRWKCWTRREWTYPSNLSG